MTTEKKKAITIALQEWRKTQNHIPDAAWEELSSWIEITIQKVRSRNLARIGVLNLLQGLLRPPKSVGLKAVPLFYAFIFWVGRNSSVLRKDSKGISPRNLIIRAPGSRLLSLVEFLYSPGNVEYTFKPIISDWRSEYFLALRSERCWKARWISVRYFYAFALAMGLSKIFSIFKKFLPAGK